MKTRVLLTAAALALAAVAGNTQQTASDGLGTVHFPISCTPVQAKFDRAVALLHNFHYPETVKAFQAVIKDDPDCAIAYWGLAMTGPRRRAAHSIAIFLLAVPSGQRTLSIHCPARTRRWLRARRHSRGETREIARMACTRCPTR